MSTDAQPRSIVYFDGTDLEREGDALMRFHLTYSGNLLSNRPQDAEGRDERAAHKHCIRRYFHPQLKRYWASHPFLGEHSMDAASRVLLPDGGHKVTSWRDNPGQRLPMSEVLGQVYGHSGYRFVPLVREEISLSCSLRIICLRRNNDSAVLVARDIDNRVKTVIDALTMPLEKQGCPLGKDKKPMPPQDGEDPFFVLLDDDRQVTHLEVQTDDLLEVPPGAHESYVRLLIAVEIRPIYATTFNLSFA